MGYPRATGLRLTENAYLAVHEEIEQVLGVNRDELRLTDYREPRQDGAPHGAVDLRRAHPQRRGNP